jgi:hypothetical protein
MLDRGDLLNGMIDWGPLRDAVSVADVLIVAYLFYRLMLLVKGTRAMQMAVGLGLVFLMYHVARRLGLVTLYTILDALLTYIVLLIVVIFQNDIRRVLARVGQRPWFRGTRNVREALAARPRRTNGVMSTRAELSRWTSAQLCALNYLCALAMATVTRPVPAATSRTLRAPFISSATSSSIRGMGRRRMASERSYRFACRSQ